MKALIIYDSVFGNTGKVAQKIYNSFPDKDDVKICQIKYFEINDLKNKDVIIIGSPTRGFRPTEAIKKFIKGIPSNFLNEVQVTAFDTRLSIPDINSSFVKFIVKNGGYAAHSIASHLQKKGGKLFVHPEGFLVTGEEGPLKEGELEKAEAWVKIILNTFNNNKSI
ncbi:MAG: flavodoxin family protein [Bacteroidales bacterium]|nr:flavodoxin family protein [Bacteroidales bacterium]